MKQIMITKLICKAIEYNSGDLKRIDHLLKVHSYAHTIAILESINPKDQFILESAAILHDIGIKICEEKYGTCSGKCQEKEGPPIALKILENLKYEENDIDRILFLIAHHHSYNEISKIDHQILIEADFLVNLDEENCNKKRCKSVYEKYFKTKTGKYLCKKIFNLKNER